MISIGANATTENLARTAMSHRQAIRIVCISTLKFLKQLGRTMLLQELIVLIQIIVIHLRDE